MVKNFILMDLIQLNKKFELFFCLFLEKKL